MTNTDFKYCSRHITYSDDDYVCLADVHYVDIFTGESIVYMQFGADDPEQSEIDMRLFEAKNHLIVDSQLYIEDVEAILNDFIAHHEGVHISIYVEDVIDITIPISCYSISEVLDVLDMVSFNTVDDILIALTHDKANKKFEFYA